ncbi:hypothetical protein [Streptomyces sp. NPDC004435]|uniref:hypothetical protein n=1 Tax=Streptomyces sp. NPDC004435 TaxID=3364701 RepID=UPI0036C1A239
MVPTLRRYTGLTRVDAFSNPTTMPAPFTPRPAAGKHARAATTRHDERGYASPETAPGAALTLRLRS